MIAQMSRALSVPDAECYASTPQDLPTVRQWSFFPAEDSFSGRGPRPFCVLIESADGCIAAVKVTLRTAPDCQFACCIGSVVDDHRLAFASRERIAGEVGERYGASVEFLDMDIDADSPLAWPELISRRVAQLAIGAASSSPVASSLSNLRVIVQSELESEWKSTSRLFVRRLNPDAVERIRTTTGELRPSAYNYMNGGLRSASLPSSKTKTARSPDSLSAMSNYRVPHATTIERRAQALATFPFLERVIAKREYESIRSSIDTGEKLVDALAVHFGVSRGIIRLLRDVSVSDLGRWGTQVGTLLRLLESIPANWWPRNPETWGRFVASIDAITLTTRQPIATSTNVLWLFESARRGFDLSVRGTEEMVRVGQEIDDMSDALRQALVWEVRRTTSPQRALSGPKAVEAVSRFKAAIGLVKLADVARRYGDAYRRATLRHAEEAQTLKGLRWPSIGGPASYGIVNIVPLHTPDELREEGIRMFNCAASYVRYCHSGKCQLWSVQHWDGTRLSTLETSITTGPACSRSVVITQHRGSGNGPPSPVAALAAEKHVLALSNHPSEIHAYLNWRESIVRTPLEMRKRQALMLPMVSALREVLPSRWAFERLLEVTVPNATARATE